MSKTKPTNEELIKFQDDAVHVAGEMAKVMFETNKDKRVCMVGALRVAAGTAAMGGMDLHRAIHVFMTFYKDAEEQFGKKGA